MLVTTEIAVKDACIFIDLVELCLMDSFYRLNLVVYTTPQVIAEIMEQDQVRIINGHIRQSHLKIDNDGLIERIEQIAVQNKGLSLADCSVLEVGLRRNCVILSCDGTLRKTAISNSLTVRGIIWVIEELFINDIITKEMAIKKLKEYLVINQWVPKQEIHKLISKLKQPYSRVIKP